MIRREMRVLLRHYLEEGFGVDLKDSGSLLDLIEGDNGPAQRKYSRCGVS